MPQQFEGPVTVTAAQGPRQTVIRDGSVQIGQLRAPGGRKKRPGFKGNPFKQKAAGLAGNPAAAGTGQVVVDPDKAPTVPDVSLDVGDKGISGGVSLRDRDDRPTISFNGANGTATLGTERGTAGEIVMRAGANGPVILVTGEDGRITFLDDQLRTTLVIDGMRGDVEMVGADCAEDFDVAEPADTGAVLCIDDDGALRPCRSAYDRRVVGVVSGAGGLRPGVRLDRRHGHAQRLPLALVGKVFCLVDAEPAPIAVGDLLTTSTTSGHAMRADDPARAFGAVLGKTLAPLARGRGLVPVLVALQ